MTLNDPDVVQSLTALHDAYERALVANDADALALFFWDSPWVVRYGVAEQLYGAESLRAYRQAHVPPFSSRRLLRREITTFGAHCATIMSEFELLVDGVYRHTRQSQTWVALPQIGWRIVAAHVSAPVTSSPATSWATFAEAMAHTLALPIQPAHMAGVIANLERTASIAAPLLAFTLADDEAPAAVFNA